MNPLGTQGDDQHWRRQHERETEAELDRHDDPKRSEGPENAENPKNNTSPKMGTGPKIGTGPEGPESQSLHRWAGESEAHYDGRKPLRHDRPVGVGHESAIETTVLLGTESPAVARWGVCVCGASIAHLDAPGEWRSGSGSERGVAVLALEVLRAENVDIGAEWSVTATMENSTRSSRATQAEYSKGVGRWVG